MQIGQQQYPIQESILFLLLIIVLGLDVFLFNRGHGSYTVKYELMKKHRFFRLNQSMTKIVDIMYFLFFTLPFIIIVAITILRAIKDVRQFPPILVNGLIVILIIYPFHRELYYFQYGMIWFLALASQAFSQFLKDPNPNESSNFIEISFIFYTANSMVFCLALLFNEKVYWELDEALELCDPKDIKEVNQTWTQNKQRRLPEIFYGGIYGSMSKNDSFSYFIGIYIFSLMILGGYAVVIYQLQNQSTLGITGLITSFIYDIFIFIFSSLKQKERSIKNLFFMVYVGRLLSFVFGKDFWLFGYCIMYFLVGIFIGNIIIDKHFPLKIQTVPKDKQKINALKTPEFVLLILTVQIVALILVQELSSFVKSVSITFHEREIPVWQFAILIVLATWVVILYLICGRLLSRHIKKIHSLVEYYFGFVQFSQYHVYMILTYLLIIIGGLYCLLYLNDKDIFLACAFLPFIYFLIFEIGSSWVKNDFSILADTEEHNRRELKKFEIKKLKRQMLRNKNKNSKEGEKILNERIQKEQSAMMKTGMDGTQKKLKIPRRLPPINSNSVSGLPYTDSKIQRNEEAETQHKQQQEGDNKGTSDQNIEQFQQSSEQSMNLQIFGSGRQHIQKKDHGELDDFKQLKNWRLNPNLTYGEIWDNLTKDDKTILLFAILAIITFSAYSVVSYLWANNIGGLAFSLSIISLITSFVYYKINMTSDQLKAGQVIVAVAGYLLGLAFWAVNWQFTFAGTVWAVVAIILYALSLQTGFEKDLQTVIVVILLIKISLLACFICVLLGLSFGVPAGIVALCIVLSCFLGILNMHHIQKSGSIPKLLKYVSVLSIGGMIVGITVVGLAKDILSDFAVFTVVIAIIIIGLLIVYLLISYTKSSKQYLHPHVYSAYGLTIYRFQSQNQKLKTSTNHVVIFNASMVLLVVYSSVTTLFFKEKYLAIYALSIFMIAQFTELIFRSIETYYFFGQNRAQISKKIVSEAFKAVIERYMPDQTSGKDSPYYLSQFQYYIQQIGKTPKQQQELIDKYWSLAVENKLQVIKNQEEEEKFLFFWLALIRYYIYTEKQNKMNDFLMLMEEIQDDILPYGIVLEGVDSSDPIEIRYKTVQKQIKALSPSDMLIVQKYQKLQLAANKKKLKQLEKDHQWQEEAHKKKMEELFNSKQKQVDHEQQQKKEIENQAPKEIKTQKDKEKIKQSVSANQLAKKESVKQQTKQTNRRSGKQQLESILKGVEDNKLWVDEKFKHTDSNNILGSLAGIVFDWKRPDPREKFICGSGMSPDDVKQGKIGDCYLISSFAVLGQEILKQSIGQIQGEGGWKNEKGAYMVRFYQFNKEVYVVVDDFLPVDRQLKRVFAVSQDPQEFWPCILQKAYAKLYGGYQNIISGKCHQVLAEFTGGFPFQVLLQTYKSNKPALWNRIMNAFKNKYLLASGSPENARGDAAKSKKGIVQGHAYAILEVMELGKDKLLKLKNPHGSGGIEWNGPYSDVSDQMKNQKIKAQLKHQKKNDGIFWMDLDNFINQFKSLYICCIFRDGWKRLHEETQAKQISDTWESGKNSFGRPDNPDSHKNYQLGVTVTKKCILFISLSQQPKTALSGQNYIYIRVQRNEGKRLSRNDVNSENLCGAPTKPTDLITISQQIQLQNSEYPYTFTIYVSAQVPPPQNEKDNKPGKGKFKMQLFCNDLESKLIEDKDFDLQTKNS